MSPSTRLGRSLFSWTAAACVLLLIVAGVLWWTMQGANSKRITAYFTGTVGLYEANDVRIQGVKVGDVSLVQPRGDRVQVDLEVDREFQVPANAKAVIVAPSLVSDRYVQLTPTYRGGPEMREGTVLQPDRTATPLEVDDLYASLNRVSRSLGPNGANRDGALSGLLNTLAKNMDGNGQQLNDTITHLGEATRTLSGNKEDLFSTVDNLQKFTTMLAGSDQQVAEFSRKLAGVNEFLAGERGNLAATVDQLGVALTSVQGFIAENRGRLRSNVDKLADVTKVLVDERAALAETLDVAPTGLANLFNTYDPASGTLHARDTFRGFAKPPIVTVCTTLRQVTPDKMPQILADVCDKLAPVIDGALPMPSFNEILVALQEKKLPPLPLPLTSNSFATPTQGGGR